MLCADWSARPARDLRAGDVLIGFDAPAGSRGGFCKVRTCAVEAVWSARVRVLRIETATASVLASADQRWIGGKSYDAPQSGELAPKRTLRRLPVASEDPADEEYRAGYVSGSALAGGSARFASAPSSSERERLRKFLDDACESRGYRRGFLGGVFDAEGRNGGALGFAGLEAMLAERIRRCAASLAFRFEMERRRDGSHTLQLAGTYAERIRFLSTVQPAARRHLANLGSLMHLAPEPVLEVAPEGEGERDAVDVRTSSGTLFAAGLAAYDGEGAK
jgi:hypothetical protein